MKLFAKPCRYQNQIVSEQDNLSLAIRKMSFIGAIDRENRRKRWAARMITKLHFCITEDRKRKNSILKPFWCLLSIKISLRNLRRTVPAWGSVMGLDTFMNVTRRKNLHTGGGTRHCNIDRKPKLRRNCHLSLWETLGFGIKNYYFFICVFIISLQFLKE